MKLQGTVLLILLMTIPASAQDDPKTPPPDEKTKIEEVMVVTASRTEQVVHDVPAAVTVLTAEDIEDLPVDDYGDILRNVPGVNVTQISARDIQVTARSATNSLATSQLVMLDGRSLYLDFFGFVMWDFLPVDVTEIKQIEVVRGPGSAVWGANAMSGVINLITKRPSDMQGTTLTLGGGDRGTLLGSALHAGARGSVGYKVSASFYRQDAFDRPAGLVPGTTTPYPSFKNEGTEQPKVDLRLDYDLSDTTFVTVSGGYAGTDGLVHSGIGPFDIESGASMKYAKAGWNRGSMRVSAFANLLDADSTNLLAFGVNGQPISFAFKTNTYSVDASNTTVLKDRHVLTYGATARHNDFELSIAPQGRERQEIGGFLQDEMMFGKLRWVLGARLDNIDPIGSVVSPRTALLYSPVDNHTMRVSFGRAFRAPSLVNNYLDTAILSRIDLPTGPFILATRAVGNPTLTEERMDAYEVGYVGTLPGLIVSANVYRNKTTGSTDFYPATFYNSANPPAGWPLPALFLDFPPLKNALPSSFSYRNVGQIVDKGLEVAVNAHPSPSLSWFVNYSYQADPEVQGVPAEEVNVPPSHRINVGGGWDGTAFFVNGNVNYQDAAIWRDVLDARYWGPTESFTSIGASLGYRPNERMTFSVTGTNLLDERIQQHVFGDIIGRRLTAKVQFNY